MYDEGKLAYKFKVFGGEYGYFKDEIFSEKNMVLEMHYSTIYDWKKVRNDIKTIYILPSNIEIAKKKTIDRNLSKETEVERLKEIDEHFNKINTDRDLRNQFDYFIYNNYDKESENNLIELVNEILKKNRAVNYN